jgi:hypothetical protein
VRKLIAFACAPLLLAGACRRTPTTMPSTTPAVAGSTTGAPDPRGAVVAFLDAAKSQDLQALAGAWGSTSGSVRTSGEIPRDEMERRELIMLCYLNHDSRQILSEVPSPNNERVLAVQLKLGTLTRTSNFYAVATPGGRWYVRQFDMEPLQDFCKNKRR